MGVIERKAIEEAKAEILAELAKTSGKLDVGVTAQAVKNVQRGVINIAADEESGTATINAVETSKAEVLFSGFNSSLTGNNSYYPAYSAIMLTLTDAITVTATRTKGLGTVSISYQVTEYY